jgi:peroxiredoxin
MRLRTIAFTCSVSGRVQRVRSPVSVRFPLLSDPKREVIRAYGVEDQENGIAWPAIFIVGRDGKVRWRSLAETFKVRPTSEVVLEALDAAAR